MRCLRLSVWPGGGTKTWSYLIQNHNQRRNKVMTPNLGFQRRCIARTQPAKNVPTINYSRQLHIIFIGDTCGRQRQHDKRQRPVVNDCGNKEAGIKPTTILTRSRPHQRGGLAQPPKVNSQNMTVHDPSVCVASVVFQVHS